MGYFILSPVTSHPWYVLLEAKTTRSKVLIPQTLQAAAWTEIFRDSQTWLEGCRPIDALLGCKRMD